MSRLQVFLDNGVVFAEDNDYDKIFQRKLTGDLSLDNFFYTVNDGHEIYVYE